MSRPLWSCSTRADAPLCPSLSRPLAPHVRSAQTAGPTWGYSLKPDGTYAYDRAYLEQLARLNGYETVILKRHSTMVERGQAAPGYMGVLRKPMQEG